MGAMPTGSRAEAVWAHGDTGQGGKLGTAGGHCHFPAFLRDVVVSIGMDT